MNNCGWVRNGGKCILEQENKKYKEIIDKAIEYIETNTCWELRTSKVLDILKEVSK